MMISLIKYFYLDCCFMLCQVGNLLSCVVFLNTHLKMRSSSYYLAALATADFGFLATLMMVWLNNNLGVQVSPGTMSSHIGRIKVLQDKPESLLLGNDRCDGLAIFFRLAPPREYVQLKDLCCGHKLSNSPTLQALNYVRLRFGRPVWNK